MWAADSLGLLRIPHQVGLPIMVGTEGRGNSTQEELRKYVKAGLTPLEALQSATLNPAKYLRGTDSLGTVTAGKLADLVLLDGNPLADITNTMKIRAVVANGRYFDRAALDGLLAKDRTKRP
jgi:imidazolonepropionase-like amidohydrolase